MTRPLIIFGGSGDLARAKVLPAVLRLRRDGIFPEGTPLIFVARRALDLPEILGAAAEKAADAAGALPSLLGDARVVELPLGDAAAATVAAPSLPPDAVAYASLPPSAIGGLLATAEALRVAGRLSRLAIEKPLGRSLAEAEALLSAGRAALGDGFYLVDHYAWKAATRGLRGLVARGAANLPACESISRIELRMRESIRVGRRAAFYDEVGATRDVFQSHGLLLIAEAIAAAAGVSYAEALASLRPTDITRARYLGYEEEGSRVPEVETAAKVSLVSSALPAAAIEATFGKALPGAGVSLSVFSFTGDEWRLSVQPEASVSRPGSAAEIFEPEGVGYDAYEGAVAAVLSGDFSGAPRPEDALAAWRVTDAALAISGDGSPLRYPPGEEPSW